VRDVLIDEGLDALRKLGLYSCAQRIADTIEALKLHDQKARRALSSAGHCGDGHLAEMITRALSEARARGKDDVGGVYQALANADSAFPDDMEGTVADRIGQLRDQLAKANARTAELENELARWKPSIDVLKNAPPSRLDELLAALEKQTTVALERATELVGELSQATVDALLHDATEPAAEPNHLASSDRWKTTEEAHAAFLSRWKEFRTPGGLHIARCKRCGFEEFTFAEAKIDKHDKACAGKEG
jgi:hypothetical protein